MKRALKQRTVREKDILKACIDLLEAERIPVYRMNSGKIILRNGNGSRRCIKLNPEGTPDLLFHWNVSPFYGWHRVCWVETKAPGKHATDAQIAFCSDASKRGERYILVDDVKQLQDWLTEMRK